MRNAKYKRGKLQYINSKPSRVDLDHRIRCARLVLEWVTVYGRVSMDN